MWSSTDWLRPAEGRKTVVFAVNVAHAVHLRNEFRRAGVPAAQAVVIVLLGPWALKASEMWAASMFGKYLRIHNG